MEELIEKVKTAKRIKTDAFNSEIEDLIQAALYDLGITGVKNDDIRDPLIRMAIILYCKLHFGEPEGDVEWLQNSYNELKGHLRSATGYTDWGEDNE